MSTETRPEPARLAARPSYQTSEPVQDLRITATALSWGELVRQVQDGDVTYDLPYQRGSVWNYQQRIMLVHSILSGTPIPAIIVNARPRDMWYDAAGERLPVVAVIDGQQRLTAIRLFVEDDLPVPASWFPAEDVETVEQTEDGPYVRFSGLTLAMQRSFKRMAVPVAEARLASIADEAAVYLRVNGSGTPQSDEDMARAARVAADA